MCGDIPIGQISSISFPCKRNYFFAIGSLIATILVLIILLGNLDNVDGKDTIIMLLLVLYLILSGTANWIGHHTIIVSTSGQNRKPLKVEMSKTKEGRQFITAVKKTVFK